MGETTSTPPLLAVEARIPADLDARLTDEQLLCVFHTDVVAGSCEVRGVTLRERS